MKFAIDDKNIRIEVSHSGEKAFCPGCNSTVIGNKGEIKAKYWRHKSKECDSWYEPMSLWHLTWQNYFPLKNQEIVLKDTVTNNLHRADIMLDNGLVIEVQNSPIKQEEIRQRESFYGKHNMIWIINGQTLASNSTINYRFNKKVFSFCFELPEFCPTIEYYNLDEFKEYFFDTDFLEDLQNDPDLKNFKISNGYFFEFDFHNPKDFQFIEKFFYYTVREILNSHYMYYDFELAKENFNCNFKINYNDHYQIMWFEKKHWRKFIDECKFPVFIHQLNGLDDSLLYWYQEEKIIPVKKFLEKYLSYT